MARKKTVFYCTSCHVQYAKWQRKCSSCNSWNTIEEMPQETSGNNRKGEAVTLGSVPREETQRISTTIDEFDLICGGGIVPGSVILIGGEPGIGKSTIALQVASHIKALYISGEESPAQVAQRAERLGLDDTISLSVNTSVDQIESLIAEKNPRCCIIDSIQTISSPDTAGSAGSVSQIRESASRLTDMAKKRGISLILIGHITKDGSIAGPKVLEHLVDTVLYFEGDFTRDYRILRAFKNRYGSVNEIGIFRMTAKGLEEIKEKNSIFLSPSLGSSPGLAVTPTVEGSRILLVEVQSLVTFSSFPNPRRMSDGMDLNRLIILAAVLERHGELKLGSFDIFVNIGGGLTLSETSTDLAVAMAITSSLKNVSIPGKTAFLGEIALTGEIRPVSQCTRRLNELKSAGFNRIILSHENLHEGERSSFSGTLTGVKNIREAISLVFPG
jgi:DNA repair protein RadA/Sms